MEHSDALNDVRFLREVVANSQRDTNANRYWPISLAWGINITAGYAACAILGMTGHEAALPWVWPFLIFVVGWPVHWLLIRRVKGETEKTGVRFRFRKDLAALWLSITAVGLMWTAGIIVTGGPDTKWWVLSFLWCSLYLIGYVMNGVLISLEWFWAAGFLLIAATAAFAAGPGFYWMPGLCFPITFLVAGIAGFRQSRQQKAIA